MLAIKVQCQCYKLMQAVYEAMYIKVSTLHHISAALYTLRLIIDFVSWWIKWHIYMQSNWQKKINRLLGINQCVYIIVVHYSSCLMFCFVKPTSLESCNDFIPLVLHTHLNSNSECAGIIYFFRSTFFVSPYFLALLYAISSTVCMYSVR